MEIIPARWTAARFAIGRLHHARVGSNSKTLANHKSNVRAALLWFGNEKNMPSRGMPLMPTGICCVSNCRIGERAQSCRH